LEFPLFRERGGQIAHHFFRAVCGAGDDLVQINVVGKFFQGDERFSSQRIGFEFFGSSNSTAKWQQS
jgi:hypothetical protein